MMTRRKFFMLDVLNLMEGNLRTSLDDENEKVHVFTHLSHFYGQGCSIYTTYAYRAGDNCEQTLSRWKKMKVSTSEIIVNNRGTISHQHGVGKDHAAYLAREKGELAMSMLKTLCRSVDDKGILNPGTLFVDD